MSTPLATSVNIDSWTFFDYKNIFNRTGAPWRPGGWVGDHERRLQAYRLLESYYRLSARKWLDSTISDDDRNDRREYGDSFVIVESVLSSLKGNKVKAITEGAVDRENEEGSPEVTQQNLIEEWMNKERFEERMTECERDACKLGDGVYVLGWDEKRKRPRLRVYNPGFYFPVLSEEDEEDFPPKVHIAWEFERKVGEEKKKYVRRITWELLSFHPETFEPIEQRVPWESEPINISCFMSDGTWLLEDAKGFVEEFSEKNVVWKVHNLDLGLDFIPVVHIANPPTSRDEHYGTSVLAPGIQINDDLISTDTDLQSSSAIVGTPPISLGGSSAPRDEDGNILSYGPGSVYETGDGEMSVLDTSKSLDALIKYDEHLKDRLGEVNRVPGTLLGRVDPSKVQSGIILTLSFAPHSSMIREMRMMRKQPYSILFKFLVRFYWKDNVVSQEFPVNIEFGSYLPADRTEVMGIITNGMNSHAMSVETAVALLIEAGYPIEDAALEVQRIQEQNFDAAQSLADATGDVNLAREFLGLETSAIPGVAAPAPGVPAGPGGAAPPEDVLTI